MHLHSTQCLITKWPGTIYAPLCLFSCSPHGLLAWECFTPSCRVTDGFSCRQTITAEAFGCIPFVSVGETQQLDGNGPVLMQDSLFSVV